MKTDRKITTCMAGAAWIVRARNATPMHQQAVAAEKHTAEP